MSNTTSRLALTQPVGSDNPSVLRTSIGGNATTLDNAALVTEGTLANRPAAGTVEHNRVYHATDTSTWYVCDGTNWNLIGTPLSGTAAARPAAGVFGRTYYATDTGVWSVDNGSAWQDQLTTRGAVNISASESRTNTAYGTLATPDQVTGLVLPANGLIRVWYQATWKESVAQAGRAAIFIGSNQLKVVNGLSTTPAAATQAAATQSSSTNSDTSLVSCAVGLVSSYNGTPYTGDVTTGQAVGIALPSGSNEYGFELGGSVTYSGINTMVAAPGGSCDIFAAAGTYTVSVQFKASSGSVTASNRKLWVQALSFS